MSNIGWEFVSTGGGREDGIHNAMIEQFSGNYNYSLAREIIQNSLDAKLYNSKLPVTVVFKLEEFTPGEFPGQRQLLEVLEAGREYYKLDNDTQEFMKVAIGCLSADTIPFLKVSDFNTRGLSGADDDKKGGWYNLVKSTGASSKSEGQGGSFGIGKGAPFAASNLRVVFYSTKTENSFTKFQGIAELVSHKKNEDVKRGPGAFGVGQGSIQNPIDIPEKFRRKEVGTDIFIAGYKSEKGWEKNLIKSILRNFWYAINNNDLIVKVEQTEINKNVLEKLLVDHFMNEKFKDEIEPKGNPLQYYLTFKNGKMFSNKLPLLGDVNFFFFQIEEQLNHVAMIRKSHMIIYSRRFNFPGNYAGVFICDDEKGNQELRKMEPPAHDKWIAERNKEKGARIMDEIINFVKKCLDEMKVSKTSGILDIPELYKYLPYDDGEETGKGNSSVTYSGEESEIESSKKIQKTENQTESSRIEPFKVNVLNNTSNENGAGGIRNGVSKLTGKKRKGAEGQDSKNKIYTRDQVLVRSFLFKQEVNFLEYVIVLKSKVDGKCNLKITAIGEEGSEKLTLKQVVDQTGFVPFFSGNNIQSIYLTKGQDTRMYIGFESAIKISLKVDIYGV